MKNQKYLLIAILFLLVGCSSGNPIATQSVDETQSTTGITSANMLGAYELTIDVDSMTAELTPHRESAIGESWTVSGKSYFDTQPCRDCFRISGIGYEDGRLILDFSIRHPFEPGDTEADPSARNRLDLDIFDLAMIVAPKPLDSVSYPLLDIDIPEYTIHNPDGFTNELSDLLGSDISLPYVLVIDDSVSVPPSNTFNKFEMGASADFETKFPVTSGQTLVFDLYLTFGYGFSAVLEDRLRPKYFNPEFNRKAAWKVEVEPPHGDDLPAIGNTWDENDDSTKYDINVKVYDWQIGASVNPSMESHDQVYALSEVESVNILIPGMTDDPITVAGSSHVPGGTGMPDSPLVYNIPMANENLLTPGEYMGIVAVHDTRTPLELPEMRDYLIHTPDSGKTLNDHEIPAYVTYQTFKATVVESTCGPITGEIISPDCPVVGLTNGSTLDFVVTASSEGLGDPIVLYEIDYNYDGVEFNTMASNSTGIFDEVSVPFIVPSPCNENIPSDFTVAIRATDSCDPPNTTIFATCLVTVENCLSDGSLIWAKREGGTSSEQANDVTSLSDNSTVVIGYFQGTVYFGRGESNETRLDSFGDRDIFIARYDPYGNLIWAKSAGGSEDDRGLSITALSDDSFAITGFFAGTAVFAPNETNETTLTSQGSSDLFVARYDQNGNMLWVRRDGGTQSLSGNGIATDSDDSIIVTGGFLGNPVFGWDEGNMIVLHSAGASDIFIAKYNPDGTFEWARSAGGASGDASESVTVLSDNSSVITGYFYASATFAEGLPNETTLTSSTGAWDFDIFIARYSENGSFVWAKSAGGSTFDTAHDIMALPDNSVVVTGVFEGTATFGKGEAGSKDLVSEGGRDVFIARFNYSNGNLIWAKSAGGSDSDTGNGIIRLSDNSIVITGSFMETAYFDKGEPTQMILESAGSSDMFIARYNIHGELMWVTSAEGDNLVMGNGITKLSDDSIVTVGQFRETAIFGSDEPYETSLISDGSDDVFIARFEP